MLHALWLLSQLNFRSVLHLDLTQDKPIFDPESSQKHTIVGVMAPSKFVEILDTTNTPYSQANVSLEDVLGDARHRTSSTDSSSSASSEKSTSRETSPANSATATTSTVKTRLRGLSIRKLKP